MRHPLASLGLVGLLTACSLPGPVSFGRPVGDRILVEQCRGAIEFTLPAHTRQLPMVSVDNCSAWYRSAYLESGFLFGHFPGSSCSPQDRVREERRGSFVGHLHRCRDQNREVLALHVSDGSVGLHVFASFTSELGERQARELIESVRVRSDP